jgi:hypothetical protein
MQNYEIIKYGIITYESYSGDESPKMGILRVPASYSNNFNVLLHRNLELI